MAITTLDLTGIDPDYKIDDDRFAIFKRPQVVTLKRPAYLSSINVHRVTDTGTVLLQRDVDYYFAGSDRDDDAKSMAVMAESTFTSDLVKSITINRELVSDTPFQITCEYQTLTPDPLLEVSGYDGMAEYNPKVMADLIDRLMMLESINDPVSDVTSDLITAAQLLVEDYTGVLSDNYVTDEEHYVDTASQKAIIRPANGAFYAHDLVITASSSGRLLRENVDYKIIGSDIARTKACHHDSGVYNFIMLSTTITGNVKIDYRAFGGDTSQQDMLLMKDTLESIIEYLKRNNFLTEQSLGSSTLLKDLSSKLNNIQSKLDYMSLGGIIGGQTIVSVAGTPPSTPTWFTIAHLHRDLSGDIVTKDTGRFRITVPQANIDFEFGITLDINRSTDQVQITPISGSNNAPWETQINYRGVELQVLPTVRGIWNEYGAGICLQVGFLGWNSSVSDPTVICENLSSMYSSWQSIGERDATPYSDGTNVTLPDGLSVWQDVDTHPHSESVFGYSDGFLMFAGVANLQEDEWNDGANNHKAPVTRIDHPEVFNRFVFKIWDRKLGRIITHEDYHSGTTEYINKIGRECPDVDGSLLYYSPDLCSMEYSFGHLLGADGFLYNHYHLTVTGKGGPDSIVNRRFELIEAVAFV